MDDNKKFVYEFVTDLRDRVYRYQRHLENPNDSRFVWSEEDEQYLSQSFNFLKSLSPAPSFDYDSKNPDSKTKLLEYIIETVKEYEHVAVPNLPPKEVVKAYEEHLEKEKKELEKKISSNPKLAASVRQLREQLKTSFPQASNRLVDQTVNQVSSALLEDSSLSQALNQSAIALQEIGLFSNQRLTPLEISGLILLVDELIELNPQHQQFTDFKQVVSQSLSNLGEDKAVTATASLASIAALSFSRPTILTSTAKPLVTNKESTHLLDSLLTTKLQSPQVSSQVSAVITTNSDQIDRTIEYLRIGFVQVTDLEYQLQKELSLTGINTAEQIQAIKALKTYTLLAVSQKDTLTKADTPASKVEYEKFLQRVGIAWASNQHHLPPTIASLLQRLPLSSIRNSSRSLQGIISSGIDNPQLGRVLAFLLSKEAPGALQDVTEFSSQAKRVSQGQLDLTALNNISKFALRISLPVSGTTSAGGINSDFKRETGNAAKKTGKDTVSKISRFVRKNFPYSLGGYFGAGTAVIVAATGAGAVASVGAGIAVGYVTYRVADSEEAAEDFNDAVVKLGAIVAAAGAAAIAAITSLVIVVAIVAFAVPIFIVSILFIINTSAYMVPPSSSSSTFLPGSGGFQDNASCPITGGVLKAGSYNPVSQTGHGGNVYWSPVTGVGGTACRYSLPQRSGCGAPTEGTINVCYQNPAKVRCEFYGFAADFFPPVGGTLAPVYLPLIDGQSVSWNYNGVTFANGGGVNGYTYGYTDTTGRYSILLTHLGLISNPGSVQGAPSGTQVGSLHNQGFNTHLHLEAQIDGVYVRPENYFCGS